MVAVREKDTFPPSLSTPDSRRTWRRSRQTLSAAGMAPAAVGWRDQGLGQVFLLYPAHQVGSWLLATQFALPG